jgi:PKD repeat protein
MTTSPRTTYSFPGRGTYTITLTVTDARGARSATQRVITVKRL